MTQTFDQSILSARSTISISEQICEAHECNKPATREITVNVGSLGSVALNLCKSCIPKFSDSNNNKNVTATRNGSENHFLSIKGKKGVFIGNILSTV